VEDKASVIIENNTIVLNGKAVFEVEENTSFEQFSIAAYKSLNISYPKFYKMDNLCKLGFLAAEYLLKEYPVTQYEPEDIAIVLANRASSLETDVNYYNTIKDENNYFPSPAVFVYTLANIVIGEISIRHKIKGENAFFVMPEYNKHMLTEYVDTLIKTTNTRVCITGWVDFFENDYKAELFLYQ
jgi:hypothetical protein